jgi:hypothetical protein
MLADIDILQRLIICRCKGIVKATEATVADEGQTPGAVALL